MMYTGTTAEQDNRFSDKEKKLMKVMKFGENLVKRVDMSKVKLDAMKPWISKKITEVLGIEDDVVVEFVYNQLEAEKFPDPKKMQINLTGFLNGKNARVFMTDLWDMLLSAQDSPSGIPEALMEMKKEEIKKRMEEQERMQEISRKLEKKEEKDKRRDRSRERKRSRSRDRRDRDKDKKDKARSRSKRSSSRSPSRSEKRDEKKDALKKETDANLDNGHSGIKSPDKNKTGGIIEIETKAEEKKEGGVGTGVTLTGHTRSSRNSSRSSSSSPSRNDVET